jgi:hypothetical protein
MLAAGVDLSDLTSAPAGAEAARFNGYSDIVIRSSIMQTQRL